MLLASWIPAILAAFLPHQTASADPQVQINVAVYLYKADGSMGGSAGGPIKDADSLVWVSFSPAACGMGAGTAAPVSSAYTWKTSGRIVNHDGANYTIDVDVVRTPGAASQSQMRQKTVALGEHIVLDEISDIGGPCNGRTARLEASVEVAQPARAPGAASGRGGAASGVTGAGVSAGPIGGGRAGARAAPAPPIAVGADSRPVLVRGDPSPSMFVTNALAHLGESAYEQTFVAEGGQNGDKSLIPVTVHAVEAPYRAEVWLLHTAPDGTQRTYGLAGHTIDESGWTFRFGAVPVILSPNSWTMALVGVNLRAMSTESGQLVLRASIARAVQGVAEGASSRAVSMPKPGDVVSFELPQGPAALDGHRFEVRVRLTPAG